MDERSEILIEDDDKHELNRALAVGVTAMREAAMNFQWLKPNNGETIEFEIPGYGHTNRYELRVERSDMPNPWYESICSISRLPFRSEIILNGWNQILAGKKEYDADGNVISDIEGWVHNIDGEGRSLQELAQSNFLKSLVEGIVFAFVDNDVRKFNSSADRSLRGGRPYVLTLTRRDIIDMVFDWSFGYPRLVQLRFWQPIVETVEEDGILTQSTRKSIKVVTAGQEGISNVTVRVFVEDEESSKYVEDFSRATEISPETPGTFLHEIPLVPLPSERIGAFRGQSPFLNSAWTQASIWAHNSEMTGLAREASITMIHESGVDVDQTGAMVVLDTNNTRYRASTNPAGRLSIHEVRGRALASIRELIKDKTEQIERAHNHITSEKPTAPVTAREVTLSGVRAASQLEMWVIYHQYGWKKTLDLVSLLGGLSERGSVYLPHDFGLPSASMERNLQCFLGGHMTAKNYYSEAKRAGDVDERHFNVADEIELEKKNLEVKRTGIAQGQFQQDPQSNNEKGLFEATR